MKLMRAFFDCDKANLFEMVNAFETESSIKLDLAVHEYSEEGESAVSGNPKDVMKLIGYVASRPCVDLQDAWTYEC